MNQQPLKISGTVRRFSAYTIDSIILLIPAFLIITAFPESHYIWNISNMTVHCAYFTYFISCSTQATPGQRLLNIYTMRVDKRKISPILAFDRSISQFFLPLVVIILTKLSESLTGQNSIISIIFFLQTIALVLTVSWYLTVLFTIKNQTIHDIIFGTIVVSGKIN